MQPSNSRTHEPRHGPSPIRWAGSKRHVVSGLSAFIRGSQRHYIEPFAGSAALFFGARPISATLGDLNGKLINFYKQLRRSPLRLHANMLALSRDEATYYAIREMFNASEAGDFEQAVQFAYLNRNCFNGIWRTNQKGKFNVPFSRNSRSAYPSASHFQRAANDLAGASLKCSDFRRVLRGKEIENSVVFVDPPYFSGTSRVFVEYGSECFNAKDLEDLVDLLHEADSKGAIVIFTYNYNERIKNLFSGWEAGRISITRNIGGFSGSRKSADEMILSNCATALECLS